MKKLLSASLLIAFLWQTSTVAYSPYLDQIRFKCKQPFSCNICHHKNTLTVFGSDFKKQIAKYKKLPLTFKALGKLDSDKDGFSNHKELLSGCFPHDKLSYPKYNCLIVSHQKTTQITHHK